ncbi:uncharacterized protein Dwil_GK13549 [Drosophila willistoni]|uniref:Chitin-binding type-2 domain-containing protein n=1 Tax=Drosophila willistoni TaxID=7260 RepID=B4NI97_DROWI|nr:NEDD8-specific protease 1 [Drosophila willistoni]EDW83679.1 uncharacterized protein Dwil_GK13549 [Drosophila willistoni]
MKVIALTLLSLAALSQARLDYKLQCTRDEISIRWPSYHSNSEYYVCQGVHGNQLTVHCPAGEVFTFVLQQCAAPALYVPAPPMDKLPTSEPVTTHLVVDSPPVIGVVTQEQSEEQVHEHEHHGHHHHEHEHEHEHEQENESGEQAVAHPIPPTPAPAPPTPPTVQVESQSVKKPVPVPKPVSSGAKKPTVPKPGKGTSTSAAKKTSVPAPVPAKAAKKPAPPRKVQKKPSA